MGLMNAMLGHETGPAARPLHSEPGSFAGYAGFDARGNLNNSIDYGGGAIISRRADNPDKWETTAGGRGGPAMGETQAAFADRSANTGVPLPPIPAQRTDLAAPEAQPAPSGPFQRPQAPQLRNVMAPQQPQASQEDLMGGLASMNSQMPQGAMAPALKALFGF